MGASGLMPSDLAETHISTVAFVGDRAVAWVDDVLGLDAYAWARRRGPETLLIQPDPIVGLVEEHFERLEAFGRSCAPPTVEFSRQNRNCRPGGSSRVARSMCWTNAAGV